MLGRIASGALGPRRAERSSTPARVSGGGLSAPRLLARRAATAVVLALTLSLALAAAGCADEGDAGAELSLVLEIAPSPPSEGPARLSFVLHDAAGELLQGATVKIEGNMSHAGMVPEFAEAKETDPGRYEAALEFTMGGDWFLTFDVTTADGVHHVLEREVRGVHSDNS